MFAIFTVDTISGHHRIAVKSQRGASGGDLRHDACSLALGEWGRGARLLPGNTVSRRLAKSFSESRIARGWGFIDWSRI